MTAAPLKPVAMALALTLALALGSFGPAFAADDIESLKADLKRMAARLDALEQRNQQLEKALASDNVSQYEPEIAARLKAVEFQALSFQKQARQIEALEGITVGASIVSVLQSAGASDTASGLRETRANYRGDLSVTLPGGELGSADGNIFALLRFGQGTGIGLRPTLTSTANTTAFETGAGADDSFGILAQVWYQLSIPLLEGNGTKVNAREHVRLTFGKIDPFVFFDQNVAADDESMRFINNAFVHNPLLDSGGDIGADAYGFQPGLVAKYENTREKGGEWGLSLGVFGSGPGANYSGSLGRPFVIAQAETAVRFNYLPGNLRAYAWTNGHGTDHDGSTARHTGWGWSIDQKVANDLTLFSRYGHQTRGAGRYDRALTLGAELTGERWRRGADGLGLAFGHLRTSPAFRADSTAVDGDGDGVADGYQVGGHEQPLELYYRYRLSGNLELSPNLQWIRNPGANPDASTARTFGLRVKLAL